MRTYLNEEKSPDYVDVSYTLSESGYPYRFEVYMDIGGVVARFPGLTMSDMIQLKAALRDATTRARDERRSLRARGLLR